MNSHDKWPEDGIESVTPAYMHIVKLCVPYKCILHITTGAISLFWARTLWYVLCISASKQNKLIL